ncbi:MAG: hypothetical protein H0U52_07900 [Chloroflexi bacterium]|nr:hypothetical protein [Chloroflexota bacterium]
MFDKLGRSFAHLYVGDPARGSTGVHELGFNQPMRGPDRRGVLPTVTIVADTIESAPGEVIEVISDAIEYAEEYLRRPVDLARD